MQRLQRLAADLSTQNVELMQLLCPAIYSVAVQIPAEAAVVTVRLIRAAWAHWRQLRAAQSAVATALVPLPPQTLALLALCARLYPVTDFRHAVLTPCIIFTAEVRPQTRKHAP